MIRLKIIDGNRENLLLKVNNIFVSQDVNNETNKTHGYEQSTSDFLEKIKPVKSYERFVTIIRETTSKKLDSKFLILENENKFYIFKNPLDTNFILLCIYEPENEYMFNYIRKLLRFTDKTNYIIIFSNALNHYAFLTTWQVLQLVLTKAYVESQNEKPFESFQKPKKSGGMRTIYAPNPKIKEALRDLNYLLQTVYDKRNNNFQIAYKRGKNVKTGAEIHKEKNYVFNLDLHDFYPSCKRELVEKYTSFLFSYSYNRTFLEEEFFNVILINDGLFIGSPISGTLANAIISMPVNYMNNICKKYGMKCSVYADDISFSSDKFIIKDFVIGIFNEAFAKHKLDTYFTINEKKSVGFSGCKRKITGVTVNGDNKITISRKYYRELRVQIDHLSKGDGNIDIGKLRGKIAYATMLDESGKIYNYLNKYLSTVKQYNLCSDEKLEELKNR